MGAVRKSRLLSQKYGTQISFTDLRNLHVLIDHQDDILGGGHGPATQKTYQQD
jgi:hypothetical protein